MRLFLSILTLFFASFLTAQNQNITIEPLADSLFQIRVVSVSPTGASVEGVTRPLTAAQTKTELLARFRDVSGEIASTESSLLFAKKRAETLKILIENWTDVPIENQYENAKQNLTGDYWLVENGEKLTKITIDKSGGFVAEKDDGDGGQIKMQSPKSFLVTDYFKESRLFGLFHEMVDIYFWEQEDGIFRAKSESEFYLIRL